MAEAYALRGHVLWSGGPEELHIRPNAYVLCDERGLCAGVFDALPPAWEGAPVRQLGDCLLLPGYCDMHLHAPQYENIGLGMELTLLDWLDRVTYPEEIRFGEESYARPVYERLAAELRAGFTTRVAAFSSAHRVGTEILMECLSRAGLCGFVGRVNMDRNAPDGLRDKSAEASIRDTAAWLRESAGRYPRIRPILTPRFVPSCSEALMEGLGVLRRELQLPLQSHLGESPEEIAWVRQLCPRDESYAAVYARHGMLGPDTLMAHCVYLTEAECTLMKKSGAYVVHCPGSNANVRSGIAPIRRYLDRGMNIALGSDISGGHSLDMADAVREALSASRLLWRLGEEKLPPLTAREAFYLATAGGGAFFGKAGRFEPGYAFDAVAVDDAPWRAPGDDLEARFQKMIYRAHGGDVTAKYVAGEMLF